VRANAIAVGALLLAGVSAGCGGGGHRTAAQNVPAPRLGRTERLRADAFSVEVPAAWRRRSAENGGGRAYFLGSGGAVSDLGIAAPGAIGLTVSTARATSAVAAVRDPRGLIARVVGRPPGARSVRTTTPATRFRVGPTAGATATFTYVFRGRRIVQTDAVAVRRGRVAFIEADASPANAPTAARALAVAARTWRWAPPPAPPSPARSHDTPA
jgi:hypothetical protein